MVDFGRQFVSVFPLPVEASMLAPDAGPVWIETTSGGLQDWDETIDGVGVVRSYAAGRFMMSWDTQPVRYEPFGAANSITAPASAGPAIEELITELVTAPDHASVVALLEAATGATAAYTGPASTYDLLSFYDQPDQSGLLAVSGEPLSVERNTATWGAHDKPEPGLQVDLLGAETYARIDGQVLFWPGTAAPVEVPAESFADHVDELIDAEPTLVVTESPVLLFGCPAGVRGFGDSAAVEVAAAELVVRHEAIEVDGGWRLRIEVDAPDGFFHRDGSVLNLFFGSSVRLGATLDWDPDTGAFATPNQIVFDTLLTHEEVDLLRGHLN